MSNSTRVHAVSVERCEASLLPAAPAWIDTPTAGLVVDALRYAQLAADVVLIHGGPGLGKTKAIQRYASESPNVWHVTMSPAMSGMVAALSEIATALGGNRDYIRTASALHRRICARMRDTAGLLVIDEAQHLGVPALEQIRAIYDAGRIGLALVGNDTVYCRLTGGITAPYLDRFASRVGKRLSLRSVAEADVDRLLEAWALRDAQCVAEVRRVASKPGALRLVTKGLRLATAYAQAEARPLRLADLRAAWLELGGV